MSKFKVGDRVRRTVHDNLGVFGVMRGACPSGPQPW